MYSIDERYRGFSLFPEFKELWESIKIPDEVDLEKEMNEVSDWQDPQTYFLIICNLLFIRLCHLIVLYYRCNTHTHHTIGWPENDGTRKSKAEKSFEKGKKISQASQHQVDQRALDRYWLVPRLRSPCSSITSLKDYYLSYMHFSNQTKSYLNNSVLL